MVELGKEVENGRLLRLLAKINFVVERPAGEGAGMGAGVDGVRRAAGREAGDAVAFLPSEDSNTIVMPDHGAL